MWLLHPGDDAHGRALLDKNPHPDDAEIRQAISGQICRCTGYATIVRSVQWVAAHPAGTGLDDTAAADTDTDTAVPDVTAETEDTEVKA